jgi:hypothetical protein
MDSKGVSEQKADDYRSGLSGRNRVEDFLNLDPKEALKHHPELGNVYEILKLIENQAKQDGHSAANVSAIVNQTKVELAGRLQKGVVPAVKHEKEVNKPVIEDERGH